MEKLVGEQKERISSLEKQLSTHIANYDKTVQLLIATEHERDEAKDGYAVVLEGWRRQEEELKRQLADERRDHDTTKRLLAEQATKRWKLQQALEQVAVTENTKGRLFCRYCNNYAEDGHRDYCVVAPVLGLPMESPKEDAE